jgi:phosphoribosylanthranilate isomerase
VTLTLLPAVDVADGVAVRLVRGEAGTETRYGDPREAALAWQRDGAEWIHLVDLDAAFGRGSNRELIAEVVRSVDVAVELSGGIRDDDSLDAALATGAARVNIGTAALEDPAWVRRAIDRVGERIAVGLDVRGTTLAARGWTRDGGELFDVLARLDADGCARYVVTDVRRDGTLTGPNIDLLRSVTSATPKPVIASGGVSSLDDLAAIATVPGVEGAIVGKALYAGAFTLPEALAVAATTVSVSSSVSSGAGLDPAAPR